MTKNKLSEAVKNNKGETKDALQTLYDALNKGQQQKVVKDKKIKALFDRYGVEY